MAGDILYSGFKWAHHDTRSGYHHVVPEVKDFVDGGTLFGGQEKIGTFKRKLNIILCEVVTIIRARHYRAVFYIYPETSALFFSAPLLKLMGKRVVYALHLGEKYWNRRGSVFFRLKRYGLRFVDHFVVLSTQQQRSLEGRFPGRVSVVPHGVWLDGEYKAVSQPLCRICVVGDNFRDYDLLGRIIKGCAERFPQINFDLIGMKYSNLSGVEKLPTVTCHPRLRPDEYAHILSNSLFMLLPLHFATANNALLEAQTLGVPVLCNRIEGVTDYLFNDTYLFDDLEHLYSLVETRLAMSTVQRSTESAVLMEYVAINFSWQVIRKRVASLCLQEQGQA